MVNNFDFVKTLLNGLVANLSGYARKNEVLGKDDVYTKDEVYTKRESDNAYMSKKAKVLPSVTADDNGAFMRVVDGEWAAVELPNAEDGDF